MSVDKLVEAARDNNVDEMTRLLDPKGWMSGKPVDVNAFDSKAPFADFHGAEAALKLLLSRGANVNLASKDGTALMFACRRGHWAIVEMLLRNGAQLNVYDSVGMTALMTVCLNGHLPTVVLLLKNGADHSRQNKFGNTALHFACQRSHVSIAEYLLRNGASHTYRNQKGKLPIEMCTDDSKRAQMQAVIDEAIGALPCKVATVSLRPVAVVEAVPRFAAAVEADSRVAVAMDADSRVIASMDADSRVVDANCKEATKNVLPTKESGPVSTTMSLDEVSLEGLCSLLESWSLHDLAQGFRSQGIDGAILNSMNTSTPEALANELETDWNITIAKAAQARLFHRRLVETFQTYSNAQSSTASLPSRTAPRFVCNGAAITVEKVLDRVSFGFFVDTNNQSTSCTVKHANSDTSAVSLLREIDILRILNIAHNSAVAELYYVHTSAQQCGLYFVMEDVGMALTSLLVYDCPKHTCETLMVKLVECMETLHSARVMHGDINPQNILYRRVADDYEVKFCDFESASRVDRNELFPFEGNQFKYTPEFTCPEFLRGFSFSAEPGQLKANFAIDYFAMGLVIWQLLNTRSQPLLGGSLSEADLRSRFCSIDEWENSLQSLRYATTMASFIVKLCKLNPADRLVDHALLRNTSLNASATVIQRQLDTALNENSFLRDALLKLGQKFDAFWDSVSETVSSSVALCLRGDVNKVESSVIELICSLVAQSNSQLAAAIASNQQQQATDIMLQLQESISAYFRCAGSVSGGEPQANSTLLITNLNEILDCLRTYNAYAREATASLLHSMLKLESDLVEAKQEIMNIKAAIQEFGCQVCVFVSRNARVAEILHKLDSDEYLSSTSVVQQRQMLQIQLSKIQSAIDVLPDMEIMDAVRQQLTEQHAAQTVVLETLSKDMHGVPTLVLLLPDIPSGMERFDPTRLVKDSYRLHFLCGHTLRIMACGPDGKGYPLKAPKSWIIRMAPLLKITLVLLQAGLSGTGLPIPVAGAGNLLMNEAQASQRILQFAFDLLPPITTADGNLAGLTEVSKLDLSMEESRDAYVALKEAIANQDPTLKYSGLTFVTDPHSGKCQWVANDAAVIASFHASRGERSSVPPLETTTVSELSRGNGTRPGGIWGKWISKN